MSTASRLELTSVEDYLAGELASPVKHEFVDGHVYARADERNRHNVIAGNLLGFLYMRLRGRSCRPFNSDAKIRIHLGEQWRFYYPDASVVWRSNSMDESFQDEPGVVF